MNFKFVPFGLAFAATATATLMSGGPAQALSLTGRLSIDLDNKVLSVRNSGVDVVNTPFTLEASGGSSNTGTFAAYEGGTVLLKDLAFPFPIVSGGPAVDIPLSVPSFITLQAAGQPDLTFDLTKLIAAEWSNIGNLGDTFGDFDARVEGIFRPSGLPNQPAIDSIVSFRLAGGSNDGAIELTPVPTPALIPAALGFGAAMLRKRKGEQAAKEAADSKA